jgi:hypothetical protein
VVSADLVSALPVSGTERDDAAAAHPAVAAAVAAVVSTVSATHMRRGRHHGWWTVSITAARIPHLSRRASPNSREGASEAGCAALEVREAARGASPVAGTGPVLARGERGQDLGGPV